ncbi:uncharacterized protein LOC127866777 [Dreissena polymorpha]|uniref:Uncharacterized protein n=1 Tax=Dreissena polymorpha TaxID=45954 RepID=A0A9D4N4N7_DREPO|nr:uncharacterized protein LOC127866777 [Dreissena polymorpha]KAH3887753.1 hypothetical protein DPMN_011772 [Dreissena polymorpha]
MPPYHLPRMILLTTVASPNNCTCGHHRTTTAYHVSHIILWKSSRIHTELTDKKTENSFVEAGVEIGDAVPIGLSDDMSETLHLVTMEPEMHMVGHNRPAHVDCGDVIEKLSKKVNADCVGIKMLLHHCRKLRRKRETLFQSHRSNMDCINKSVQKTNIDILDDANEGESLEIWVDVFVGEALTTIVNAYHELNKNQVTHYEIVDEPDLDQFAQTLVVETISDIQLKCGRSPNTTWITESHDQNDTEVCNSIYPGQLLFLKDLNNDGHLNEKCVSDYVDDILENIANELLGVGIDNEFEDFEFVEWKDEHREYQYVGAYTIEVEHESDSDSTEWSCDEWPFIDIHV